MDTGTHATPRADVPPAGNHQDILRLIRLARRAIHAAGAALDEAYAAAEANSCADLCAATDFQAWECHILHSRCSALYAMAEHAINGKPLPVHQPLSSWLR